MKAWMRILTVTLTSSKLKRALTFGDSKRSNNVELNINVNISKYMSSLKDTCEIKIDNLTYSEIVQMISGEYYDVEVKCGYRAGNVSSVFKGGVLYISNDLGNLKTNTVTILCASLMVARFSQRRLSLSLNSGINTYSAMNFICRNAGIANSNVSEQFKNKILNDITTVSDTAASWFANFATQNPSTILNVDDISGASLSIYDINESKGRVIKLSTDKVLLTNGYPRLNAQGLTLSTTPTFPFVCGDTILIDNAFLNMSVTSDKDANKNYGFYLDRDGLYVIFELSYELTNRSNEFSLTMQCKSRSLIANIFGNKETI